jgi:endonuclease III
MRYEQAEMVTRLIQEGKELWDKQKLEKKPIRFTAGDKLDKPLNEADLLLNDIERYPHIFVLGCIMDKLKPAEDTWNIPAAVAVICGNEFSRFKDLDLKKVIKIFDEGSLHVKSKMGKNESRINVFEKQFFKGIQFINSEYQGDASNIWNDNPTSAELVSRFMEFNGVGQKISSMAARILVTQFLVPVKDTHCIDVPVDRHVKRIFKRMGFVKTDKDMECILFARGANPEFPGIIDHPSWNLAREICTKKNYKCDECKMGDYCPKIIED